MIAGGTPPDVAIMPIGYYMPFADVGALADISVREDAEFQALRSDLFLNILSEFVTPSGALYAPFPSTSTCACSFITAIISTKRALPSPQATGTSSGLSNRRTTSPRSTARAT